ncbi:MAG: LAGLIDADG family homing endonuclease [Candidatus Aenigmatarchaeota archaeon]
MLENELSEICGIHAGDGYLRNDGRRIELDISGSTEEKIYYDKHVTPLFSKVFGVKIEGRYFPHRNTYGFVVRDLKTVEKIHSLGFPYGKKTNIVKVPEFVLKSENLEPKKLFLRGFFDTDGCITFDRRYSDSYSLFRRKHHIYPRIILVTTSYSLFTDLKKIITDAGIGFWVDEYTPKSENESKKFRIWIRGRNVEKWMNVIGSKNPIKHSRFDVWKRYGFCPPKTTFKERMKIISGSINPENIQRARSSTGNK